MNLPDARALFRQWLAEPRRHEALDALCLVTRLERAGYFILKPEIDAPWCLVHQGRIVAVEPGQAPLAVLATGRRVRITACPTCGSDGSPCVDCNPVAAPARRLNHVFILESEGIRAYLHDGSVWEVREDGKPYLVEAPACYAAALARKERAA